MGCGCGRKKITNKRYVSVPRISSLNVSGETPTVKKANKMNLVADSNNKANKGLTLERKELERKRRLAIKNRLGK